MATQPGSGYEPVDITRLIAIGGSPRAAQALVMTAKVLAMIDGRYHASIEDVIRVAPAVLRHRLVRTFEAETDGRSVDQIIDQLLEALPVDDERPDSLRLIPEVLRGKDGVA